MGPWDPRLQHGGPVAALLGTELEALAPAPKTRIAHFALEFLGPVTLAPLEVTTEVLRPGKKIALLGATASAGGRVALRATAWRVAVAPERAADRNIEPAPALPATATTELFPNVPRFGYGEALEWRFVEGGFDRLGSATVWTRLRATITEGAEPSALARLLAMVDSANGISAELDVARYLFVPVNLTVSLIRAPEGEWVAMRAKTSIASEGIGTTHATLFDTRGQLGESLQTLFVEPRHSDVASRFSGPS